MKAYSTRVGAGPFPTELDDEIGAGIATRGHEFGTDDRAASPGRLVRRRAAALRGRGQQRQLDHAQQARHPVRASTSCRLCVGYEIDGRRVEAWPSSAELLARATPIYEAFPGWPEAIHDVRSLADLPENARRYVTAIEEHAGVPIVLVSVGPERTQTIERAWRPMRHRPAGTAGDGGVAMSPLPDADDAARRRRRRARARARLEARRRAGRERGGRRARLATR